MTFHSEPRKCEVGDSATKLRVCLDIETGPEPLGRVKEMLPTIKVPATYKKEAAIADYKEKATKAAISRAPLDATTGRVLAIGYGFSDDDDVYIIYKEDEEELLIEFWAMYDAISSATWIGFNSHSFDWPFLIRRSMKYGINFPFEFYKPIKYQKNFVDLMELYACGEFQKRISLDRLARFLGVGSKDGSGEDFHLLMKTDKESAFAYLEKDIRLTRAVWEGWWRDSRLL